MRKIDAPVQADESDDQELVLTKILLDAGTDLNGKDSNGMTPLQRTLARGHK
jgi:ankyrin repeat protein